MRIVKVEIEGRPGQRATIFRGDTGEVVVNTRHASRVHISGRDDLRGSARQLHRSLEGYDGTPGDVASYQHVIELLAD